jgi:hypothetical protein
VASAGWVSVGAAVAAPSDDFVAAAGSVGAVVGAGELQAERTIDRMVTTMNRTVANRLVGIVFSFAHGFKNDRSTPLIIEKPAGSCNGILL